MFSYIVFVVLKVLLAQKTSYQGLDGATAAFGLKRKSAKSTAWTSLLEWLTRQTFRYRSGLYFGSHRILGHITWRLPHQLTTKPRFYCVPTVFLYVFVEFVELTWHIRHDPKCENRWNFFFNPIFCHELHEILTNGFSHCNRGFLKLQMLFYDFCS